mmetsp:Transcript_25848/g.65388  ORF Transcript_25848/g.65388 Transcript_25848/m.65388 type:complete len:282 (+) Transcript_25848:2353-3198(+)
MEGGLEVKSEREYTHHDVHTMYSSLHIALLFTFVHCRNCSSTPFLPTCASTHPRRYVSTPARMQHMVSHYLHPAVVSALPPSLSFSSTPLLHFDFPLPSSHIPIAAILKAEQHLLSVHFPHPFIIASQRSKSPISYIDSLSQLSSAHALCLASHLHHSRLLLCSDYAQCVQGIRYEFAVNWRRGANAWEKSNKHLHFAFCQHRPLCTYKVRAFHHRVERSYLHRCILGDDTCQPHAHHHSNTDAAFFNPDHSCHYLMQVCIFICKEVESAQRSAVQYHDFA